ncbi:hypothetical protein HK096_007905, partial [Nowakowskiella sp. JEL0078]
MRAKLTAAGLLDHYIHGTLLMIGTHMLAVDPEFGRQSNAKELWKLADEDACKIFDNFKNSKSIAVPQPK